MIIYEPLWNTMKAKGITKYKLVHKYGIAQNTISRMVKNKPTSSVTINDLCKILDCNVQDIMTYIPDVTEDEGNFEDIKLHRDSNGKPIPVMMVDPYSKRDAYVRDLYLKELVKWEENEFKKMCYSRFITAVKILKENKIAVMKDNL